MLSSLAVFCFVFFSIFCSQVLEIRYKWWQTHYSHQYCIFPFFPAHHRDKEKRSLLYFKMGYSSSHALREHTGETQPVDKCISPCTECICRSRTTMAQRILGRAAAKAWKWIPRGLHADARLSAATPSSGTALCLPRSLSRPLSRRAKQAARAITWHISIQFPLPNVFIFGPNGMSFQRSLWSRINPGIKTDFPGSNLPSSIDFFTLTEPVLPNLTWQHTAQWTREHLGDSQRELSCVFSFSLAPTFHPLTPPFLPTSTSFWAAFQKVREKRRISRREV